jgi:excisionase family DNA binding protein
MTTTTNATGRVTAGRDTAPADLPLMSIHDVANLLGNSHRTIYRLTAGNKMPRPLKIGGLSRWSRRDLMQWIDGGCEPVRAAEGGGR